MSEQEPVRRRGRIFSPIGDNDTTTEEEEMGSMQGEVAEGESAEPQPGPDPDAPSEGSPAEPPPEVPQPDEPAIQPPPQAPPAPDEEPGKEGNGDS